MVFSLIFAWTNVDHISGTDCISTKLTKVSEIPVVPYQGYTQKVTIYKHYKRPL